ncbi:MAG: hypothetical protein ABFC89_06615 [Methanospirillum sp.]
MAMKDAKIKYLEHELEEKERVLEQMREVDRIPVQPTPIPEDARIGALERRVRELEAVVKGLTEEVLDLKALTLKLAKTSERHEVPAPHRAGTGRTVEPPSSAPTILVRPRNAGKLSPLPASQPRPVAVAEPAPAPALPAGEMDLIMQPDGTIKPELRRKNEYIIASNGPQNRRQGSRQAGDRSGRHVDAVIFADEKEPPRPPKKR